MFAILIIIYGVHQCCECLPYSNTVFTSVVNVCHTQTQCSPVVTDTGEFIVNDCHIDDLLTVTVLEQGHHEFVLSLMC